MLQNLDHALAELCREPFEDEVGVGFRDCAARGIGDVVAEDDVVEAERCCWAVREVGDGEGGGCAAVFVEEDEIGEAAALGARDQIWEDEVTSV